MLAWYRKRFDTVELNNTFYRLPEMKSVVGWRKNTPADFTFAVKGSRYLTHMKKLKDPAAGLARFLPLVEALGKKLGPVLFQLPPRWKANAARLDEFLSALPRSHRYGFELRDPAWHTAEVVSVLERWNAAFCIYDLAGFESPRTITTDFAYVRLHGPGGKYQGSYSDTALNGWAKWIRSQRRHLSSIYFYFDNDQDAFAVGDALRLKRLVEG
jgi:uncharacterized protein YecE (DUF72 family)